MARKRTYRYSNRVFKKHSQIIARQLLKAGHMSPEFFNGLYWEAFRRKPNKKGKYKLQYFTELHYWTRDYWGEYDEHSIINLAFDILFDERITFDKDGRIIYPERYPNSTLSVIKSLRHGVQQNKLHRAKTKHIRVNRANTSCKRSRRNKVLRFGEYHY